MVEEYEIESQNLNETTKQEKQQVKRSSKRKYTTEQQIYFQLRDLLREFREFRQEQRALNEEIKTTMKNLDGTLRKLSQILLEWMNINSNFEAELKAIGESISKISSILTVQELISKLVEELKKTNERNQQTSD